MLQYTLNDAVKVRNNPELRRVIFLNPLSGKELEGVRSETNQASLYWKTLCYLI